MIRNILFDMGGVLISFDRERFIARFDVDQEDSELLMREVFLSLEWAQMDRGSISEEEAVSSICERLPERLHETAQKLVSMWDRPIFETDGMADLICSLRGNGYRIFLLSNASRRQHDYWPRIPGSEYFEDTLISADVGLVKPQPEIYDLAVKKFGILPEESVFIDDLPQNAEGAYCAGMHPIVFHQDVAELRRKLSELGVCVQDAVQRSVENLNERLEERMEFLDAPNSVHDFWFSEVGAPDEEDIKMRIEDADQYVLNAVDDAVYFMGGLSLKFYPGIVQEIRDLIMDTMNSLSAEFYDLHPQGWQKYGREAEEGTWDHIVCLVRTKGEHDHWYIFWWMWSD